MSEVTALITESGSYTGAITGPLVPLSRLQDVLADLCPTSPDAHQYLVLDLTSLDYLHWTETPMGLVFMAQMVQHVSPGEKWYPFLRHCVAQLHKLSGDITQYMERPR